MIIGFSTSSAWAGVAAIDSSTLKVLWEGQLEAPQGASGACLALLQEMAAFGIRIEDAEIFAADIGPGSFTGVRVGVTMAKTFGFLYERPVTGANSFDLISPDQIVVLPSKKGEFFIRHPGQEPIRSVQLPDEPFIGFGPGIIAPRYPSPANFRLLVCDLCTVDAAEFVPQYLIEPSISIPKKPFASQVDLHA